MEYRVDCDYILSALELPVPSPPNLFITSYHPIQFKVHLCLGCSPKSSNIRQLTCQDVEF